jgi:hypothetical protein
LARWASPTPSSMPRGRAPTAATRLCTPWADRSWRWVNPRLLSTASSKDCLVRVSEATPASTASETAAIWNTTR